MNALAQQLLDEEEGRSRTAYMDSRGFWTISRGCLVDARVVAAGLCDAAMAAQDEHDFAIARTIASSFPHFDELSEVRQAVLISMCFQLGSKPLHWKDFMSSLLGKDYAKAAIAGRDTDWWRDQTRKRAEREMQMLESNQWVHRT